MRTPSPRPRRLLRAVAVATALTALPACGQIYPSKQAAQQPAGGVHEVQDVVVGFAQQQLQAPYFASMQVQAEEYANKKGFKLLFQAANKDPVIQMNQMQAMIAQGADVLIVNATSPKGQTEMMTQIASKIPVIYIETSVPHTGTTSVQSDNYTIGKESGKLTAKRLLHMGKQHIKMVIATGPATDEIVGPNRRQGFLDGLTAGGVTYEIKSEQNGEYQQDKGQVAAENMLAGNPDTDLVLGLNDCPISLKVAVRPLSLLSLAVSIGTSCCGLSRNTLHFRDHAQDTGHTSWSPKGPASDSPPPPAMESSAPAEAAAYAGRD